MMRKKYHPFLLIMPLPSNLPNKLRLISQPPPLQSRTNLLGLLARSLQQSLSPSLQLKLLQRKPMKQTKIQKICLTYTTCATAPLCSASVNTTPNTRALLSPTPATRLLPANSQETVRSGSSVMPTTTLLTSTLNAAKNLVRPALPYLTATTK
jgi:hypothetical protein